MHRSRAIACAALVLLVCACAPPASTVGAEGGVVESADGQLLLDFPVGALPEDVAIIVERADVGDDRMVARYEVSPGGLALRMPAAITYRVLDPDVDVGELRLVGRKRDRWRALPDHVVLEDERHVLASTLVLADYAVLPTDAIDTTWQPHPR